MTTPVVSGGRRARVVARPHPVRRLLHTGICGLCGLLLVLLGLGLPPLAPPRAEAAPPTLAVAVSQSSDTSAIGSSLTLTATVTWSGGAATEPTDGWSVEFTGTGDGGWTSGPVATDDGGVGTVPWARRPPAAGAGCRSTV